MVLSYSTLIICNNSRLEDDGAWEINAGFVVLS
jgi:hypothetical protein